MYKVKSIFIAGHSGPGCDGALRDDRSDEGHDIYFRRRAPTATRPISRKCHFRDSTFPESNNTESSFNKGSATIYRGRAPHPTCPTPAVHCHRPIVHSSTLPSLAGAAVLPLSRRAPPHENTHQPRSSMTEFFPVIPLAPRPGDILPLRFIISINARFIKRYVSIAARLFNERHNHGKNRNR